MPEVVCSVQGITCRTPDSNGYCTSPSKTSCSSHSHTCTLPTPLPLPAEAQSSRRRGLSLGLALTGHRLRSGLRSLSSLAALSLARSLAGGVSTPILPASCSLVTLVARRRDDLHEGACIVVIGERGNILAMVCGAALFLFV